MYFHNLKQNEVLVSLCMKKAYRYDNYVYVDNATISVFRKNSSLEINRSILDLKIVILIYSSIFVIMFIYHIKQGGVCSFGCHFHDICNINK